MKEQKILIAVKAEDKDKLSFIIDSLKAARPKTTIGVPIQWDNHTFELTLTGFQIELLIRLLNNTTTLSALLQEELAEKIKNILTYLLDNGIIEETHHILKREHVNTLEDVAAELILEYNVANELLSDNSEREEPKTETAMYDPVFNNSEGEKKEDSDPFIQCKCPEKDRIGETAMWVCNVCGLPQKYYKDNYHQLLKELKELRQYKKEIEEMLNDPKMMGEYMAGM